MEACTETYTEAGNEAGTEGCTDAGIGMYGGQYKDTY